MNYLGAWEQRLRSDAANPLVTWYQPSTPGVRVELSGRTFGNWVDKAAHLMTDELDLQPGDRVAMPLLHQHPGHWMSLVLVAASWHLGASVHLDAADAEVVIDGPDAQPDPDGAPTWAVSLHPLGVGLPTTAPGVLDWAGEVRAYPDLHVPPIDNPQAIAWADTGARFADLGVAETGTSRRLIRPSDPWTTVQAGLVTPILTGGSVVIVDGAATEEQLAAIARDERVDAR